MPKARSDNIGHLKSVFQEPEQDETVVKEKKKINRNPPFRREGNLGWEPVSVLLDLLTKACLTQNTRLIRLAIRVNRNTTKPTVALSELHWGHSSVYVKTVYDF